MINIINNFKTLFSQIFNPSIKINIEHLPSKGVFYKDDFELRIKKATIEDIQYYEANFDKEDVYSVIESIKKIVIRNSIFKNGYTHNDIKSIDVVYIFLEIVKFTMVKEIKVEYLDNKDNKEKSICFDNTTFNYFDFKKYSQDYDNETKEFLIKEYKLSLPAIGVEDSLTRYLISKNTFDDDNEESDIWNSYSYDFIYFVGNKSKLSFEEIDNLITIFNYDIDDKEKELINSIVTEFSDSISYTLKDENNEVIELKTKIDLCNIWK